MVDSTLLLYFATNAFFFQRRPYGYHRSAPQAGLAVPYAATAYHQRLSNFLGHQIIPRSPMLMSKSKPGSGAFLRLGQVRKFGFQTTVAPDVVQFRGDEEADVTAAHANETSVGSIV